MLKPAVNDIPLCVRVAYSKLKAMALPFGISIELDERTANILVLGKKHGFCVTSAWCREHNETLIEDVRQWFADLLAADGRAPKIYTIKKLRKKAASPDIFDDAFGVMNG